MDRRLVLHEILVDIQGDRHVYFQPKSNVTMKYPCIIYQLDDNDIKYADNRPWSHTKRYQVTVVDRDPDSVTPDKVALLPTVSFSRAYTEDNLNHTVYNVYH